jgi:zinc protease
MRRIVTNLRIWPLLCACVLITACRGTKLPKVEFFDTTLDNGLRVIIVPEHTAPIFAISLTYNTGSRNEKPGRTGLAHLFEHMMFEGSANVGKGEHGLLVHNYGGTLNGSTDTDQTNYYETLPKNQLDMVLFLESDRMRALNITQANLDNQRNVVQEERRLKVDNQPYGKSFEELEALAYDNFAYHHSIEGSMEDLNAATLDDLREFFRIYYAPNNVVMVLAGDLDPKETLAKVKKYFGDIPRQPAPPPVDVTEPERYVVRRKTLNDPFARQPQYGAVYLGPPGNTPDAYALRVLAAILSAGYSSRFYQHLVDEKQLAEDLTADFQSRRGPSLFRVVGSPRPGLKVEDLEYMIDDEIEAIKKDGPTPQEVQKVRTMFLEESVQTRASVLEIANLIGSQTVWYNDPNLVNTAYEKLAAVTAEQVKQAAQKYLVPWHRAVVITVPETLGVVSGSPSAETRQLPSKVERLNVERLNKVPINHEILKVKLPHPVELTLPNGLTVLILEQHCVPTVNYSLWIKSGALSDPKDMPGLASFTAVMLDATAKRDRSQIASELDELGASFHAAAAFGSNLTTITSSGLTESAGKVMEIMSDIVLNARFPGGDWRVYQRTKGVRLVQQRSDPDFLARERFNRAVYGDFGASILSPTLESLMKATPKALKAFHDKHYVPNNAILAISGDLTVAKATELAKKYFGEWESRPIEAPAFGSVTGPAAAKTYLVDRPGSVQSNILAGGLSLRRSDPDHMPLWVADRIMGARLYSNLREAKGYTYDAFSRVNSDLFPGVFVANTEVRNSVTDPSLRELLYEFKRLRNEKVPQAELEEAKESIVSSIALWLEDQSWIAESWMALKYYGLPADYYDQYPDRIAKIDADAVQRVARKYIDLDHLQIVVVGDASQVRKGLAKYGIVEVYDAEGKAVEAKTEAAPAGK